MNAGAIPTHRLPERSASRTRVERILPTSTPRNSGVHRHDFHELFFFSHGSGEHMIDLEQQAVKAPCMHLVSAGQVHQLSRSNDMQGAVVMFNPDVGSGKGHGAHARLFAHADRPATVGLTSDQLEEALVLVRLMEAELGRAGQSMEEVVQGFLGILLVKCASWSNGQGDRRTDPGEVSRRFLDLVERDFLEHRQVSWYARELAISADHLNQRVKERLGRTASGVIQDRLLLEARRLLLHADLNVKEVCYALNMKDPAYFTRWFHKAAGSAPADYRAHIREKYQR